uniref:G_PROTEIN_RECEP_F1_2 domain-containing protein n=1 Tax=Rhabditophanes sp. KR3021 TaxID=114890 RepID=A0AC35UBA1_9BILA
MVVEKSWSGVGVCLGLKSPCLDITSLLPNLIQVFDNGSHVFLPTKLTSHPPFYTSYEGWAAIRFMVEGTLYLDQFFSCRGLSSEEWEKERNPNTFLGTIYLVIGIFFILLYIPVICVLMKKELFENNFFKLILCLSLMDVGSLTSSSLLCGYMTIIGSVHCTEPILSYINGAIAMSTWGVTSVVTIVLALNRCLEVSYLNLANALFKDNKIYFWIFVGFLNGILLAFFTPPILYSSKAHTLSFNPFVGIAKIDSTHEYSNLIYFVNNIVLCVTLPILYSLLCIILFAKSKSKTSGITKVQKSLVIQSFMLSSIIFTSSLTYACEQFLTLNQVISMVGHFFWLNSSCVGVLVYLIFNHTIQKHVVDDFMPISMKQCLKVKVVSVAVTFKSKTKQSIVNNFNKR